MEKRTGDLKCKLLSVFFVVAICCIAWTDKTWGGNDYVAGELLIQPKAGVTDEKLAGILASHDATTLGEISQIRVKQIKVPSDSLEKVKSALSKNPLINFVEYNFLAETSSTPNDSYYSSQWHLPKISAPDGWNIITGSSDVSIAIIDSGVDPTHPDLSSKLLTGYNFLDESTNTSDVQGHGTAVAGAASAITNNYTGVAGVAWDNPILPLVVVNSSGYATYSNIARAIIYAADKGVRVINISIGGSSSSSTLQDAVNYAWNKGSVIFAAAANSSTNVPYYPAACNNVVAVSATTSSDTLASFSNYGDWIDISAPGESIMTTNNGGGYGSRSGTSFSSPISAGLAALIVSKNSYLSNVEIVNIIEQNADDLGSAGFDIYYGYGRINVYNSLVAATNATQQPDATAPTVSITSLVDASTVSGAITVNVTAIDNVGISKVELYIGGTLYATSSTAPFNFYWDTTKYSDGAYYLEARAYDPSGNVGQSNAVMVYVSNPTDTTAPVVSITSPANGSTVTTSQKINVTASDDVLVTKIELYIDGVLKTTVLNQNTLSCQWNTKKETSGSHSISTKAYDAAGNIGTVNITVYK